MELGSCTQVVRPALVIACCEELCKLVSSRLAGIFALPHFLTLSYGGLSGLRLLCHPSSEVSTAQSGVLAGVEAMNSESSSPVGHTTAGVGFPTARPAIPGAKIGDLVSTLLAE